MNLNFFLKVKILIKQRKPLARIEKSANPMIQENEKIRYI